VRPNTPKNPPPLPPQQDTDPPLSKILKTWIPSNEKNALFTLVALIYLAFAIIHYFVTGDSSMLTYLLGATAGYAGVKEIANKIGEGKDKSNSPPSDQ